MFNKEIHCSHLAKGGKRTAPRKSKNRFIH
jgi:hypothetical protein